MTRPSAMQAPARKAVFRETGMDGLLALQPALGLDRLHRLALGQGIAEHAHLLVALLRAGDRDVVGTHVLLEAVHPVGAGRVGAGDERQAVLVARGHLGVAHRHAARVLDEAEVARALVGIVLVRLAVAARARAARRQRGSERQEDQETRGSLHPRRKKFFSNQQKAIITPIATTQVSADGSRRVTLSGSAAAAAPATVATMPEVSSQPNQYIAGPSRAFSTPMPHSFSAG